MSRWVEAGDMRVTSRVWARGFARVTGHSAAVKARRLRRGE